jgi:hypothetical protein
VQGDQIGRIFAFLRMIFFGQFFKNYRSRPNFWLLFSALKITHVFLAKMGWATVWAILSQTHLVTLNSRRSEVSQEKKSLVSKTFA